MLDIGENSMNTIRLYAKRIDLEKVMITAGMFAMEAFGVVTLFCGLMDIKII